MASNDKEMKAEVRSLTDYDSQIISSTEMDSLLSIAKSEIETDVGNDLDFYAGKKQERALFWLLCLFTKIKTGEYNGMDLVISEIEMNQIPSGDDGKLWLKQFNKRLRQVSVKDKTWRANITRDNRNYSYGDN